MSGDGESGGQREIQLGETPGVQRRNEDKPEAGYELAFAWFPPDEWPKAIERWPDLLDDRAADPLEYSHQMEGIFKQYQRYVPGGSLHVAPMTVDGVVADAAERDEDPGSGDGRARYAAALLSLGHAAPWPPGRNEPCWCRSGRKYKQCCGPVPMRLLPDGPEDESAGE